MTWTDEDGRWERLDRRTSWTVAAYVVAGVAVWVAIALIILL